MSEFQHRVVEFNRSIGCERPPLPCIPSQETAHLRVRLILEEAFEAAAALVGKDAAIVQAHDAIRKCKQDAPSLVDAIDGICDAHYVLSGTADVLGIDELPFFVEVHRSNMAKVAHPQRFDDGKLMKPTGWTPPDIAGVLFRRYGVRA